MGGFFFFFFNFFFMLLSAVVKGEVLRAIEVGEASRSG